VRGVVQVAVLPVAEPTGGVQATFPFEFVPPPVSGAPGTALSATAAHQLELMVGAQKHYLSVLQGDTFAQIAAAAVTTLNQNARLLYTASQFGRTVVLGAGNSRYSFTGLAAGYSVVLLDPGQANQSLSASIANNLLTINLATDNAAALTTTGTQLSTYLTANLAAGLANKIAYAVTTGSDGSGVLAAAATFKLPYASVLLTAKHKGKTGNALPIRVRFSSDGGVRTSCGYAYFDGTSPNAASSYQLALGPESVNTVLGVSQTSTQSAAAVRDQVNAGGYAVTAASSANLLMLYHVFGLDQTEGRDVRRVGLTGTGISPQTVAGAFGVTGSGVPDLTTALAVMQGQPAPPDRLPALVTLAGKALGLVLPGREGAGSRVHLRRVGGLPGEESGLVGQVVDAVGVVGGERVVHETYCKSKSSSHKMSSYRKSKDGGEPPTRRRGRAGPSAGPEASTRTG
jgi:phage tail sheath gpL-like